MTINIYKDGTGQAYGRELPKLNVKKLLEIWDWIDFKAGHDDEPAWYQSLWTVPRFRAAVYAEAIEKGDGVQADVNYCGTAYCAAGYAARDQTYQFGGSILLNREITNHLGETTRVGEGDWSEAGQHILGLTMAEGNSLFSGTNNKEDMRRIMNAILASRGEEIVL